MFLIVVQLMVKMMLQAGPAGLISEVVVVVRVMKPFALLQKRAAFCSPRAMAAGAA